MEMSAPPSAGGSLRRGFLRLWFLVALLWIGGSLWILADNLRPGCADRPTVQNRSRTDLSDRQLICAYATTLPQLPEGFVLDSERSALWNLRVKTIAVVALPPVALFLFGWAVFWVARGFRSSQQE